MQQVSIGRSRIWVLSAVVLVMGLAVTGCSRSHDAVLVVGPGDCRNSGDVYVGDKIWQVREDMPLNWEDDAKDDGEIVGVLRAGTLTQYGTFSRSDGGSVKVTTGGVTDDCTGWPEG